MALVGRISTYYCSNEGCRHAFDKYVEAPFAPPQCVFCNSTSFTRKPSKPPSGLGDKTVVYYEGKNGETLIPMTSGPMPDQHAKAGFVRKELRTVQEVSQFERRTGKINEDLNFERGTSTTRLDGFHADDKN